MPNLRIAEFLTYFHTNCVFIIANKNGYSYYCNLAQQALFKVCLSWPIRCLGAVSPCARGMFITRCFEPLL